MKDRGGSLQRCPWATSPALIPYHDAEWGAPVHEDRLLFEFLVLEGMQAGLSWETVLKKRDNYRLAFDNFDPQIVARYGDQKVAELLTNPGIIRNRNKIAAAIGNARTFLALKREFGSFDAYVWGMGGGRLNGGVKQNAWQVVQDIPAHTPESDALSLDLKRRGFSFVGSTICYAFMQAVGLVNDHVVDCFRYAELRMV
jgi:DNA-3-methyladenine glycosylase I